LPPRRKFGVRVVEDPCRPWDLFSAESKPLFPNFFPSISPPSSSVKGGLLLVGCSGNFSRCHNCCSFCPGFIGRVPRVTPSPYILFRGVWRRTPCPRRPFSDRMDLRFVSHHSCARLGRPPSQTYALPCWRFPFFRDSILFLRRFSSPRGFDFPPPPTAGRKDLNLSPLSLPPYYKADDIL